MMGKIGALVAIMGLAACGSDDSTAHELDDRYMEKLSEIAGMPSDLESERQALVQTGREYCVNLRDAEDPRAYADLVVKSIPAETPTIEAMQRVLMFGAAASVYCPEIAEQVS